MRLAQPPRAQVDGMYERQPSVATVPREGDVGVTPPQSVSAMEEVRVQAMAWMRVQATQRAVAEAEQEKRRLAVMVLLREQASAEHEARSPSAPSIASAYINNTDVAAAIDAQLKNMRAYNIFIAEKLPGSFHPGQLEQAYTAAEAEWKGYILKASYQAKADRMIEQGTISASSRPSLNWLLCLHHGWCLFLRLVLPTFAGSNPNSGLEANVGRVAEKWETLDWTAREPFLLQAANFLAERNLLSSETLSDGTIHERPNAGAGHAFHSANMTTANSEHGTAQPNEDVQGMTDHTIFAENPQPKETPSEGTIHESAGHALTELGIANENAGEDDEADGLYEEDHASPKDAAMTEDEKTAPTMAYLANMSDDEFEMWKSKRRRRVGALGYFGISQQGVKYYASLKKPNKSNRKLDTSSFPCPVSASIAWDWMALDHRGVGAYTNFHYRYYLWPDGRVRDAPLEAELRQHYGLPPMTHCLTYMTTPIRLAPQTMAYLANMSDDGFEMYRKASQTGASGYFGVYQYGKKYCAQLGPPNKENKKLRATGFQCTVSAAIAFDWMALEHRGADAHTNFHYRYYLWPDGRVRDVPLEAELRRHYGLPPTAEAPRAPITPPPQAREAPSPQSAPAHKDPTRTHAHVDEGGAGRDASSIEKFAGVYNGWAQPMGATDERKRKRPVINLTTKKKARK